MLIQNQRIDFKLKTLLLNEVQVVSDVAIDRETPVSVSSTIPMKKRLMRSSPHRIYQWY